MPNFRRFLILAAILFGCVPALAQSAVITSQAGTYGYHKAATARSYSGGVLNMVVQNIPPGASIEVEVRNSGGTTLPNFLISSTDFVLNPNATFTSIGVTDPFYQQTCAFQTPGPTQPLSFGNASPTIATLGPGNSISE